MDRVNSGSCVRARSQENLGTRVRGDGPIVTALRSTGPSAKGRDEVLGTPHERHRGGGRRDVRGFDHASGRLAEGNHRAGTERIDLVQGFSLGQHHGRVRGLREGGDIQ